MKKLSLAVSVLLAVLVSASAQAATAISKTFAVNITLTSACVVTTAPNALNFAYTSLQTTSVTSSTTVGITCTNTLPYSVSLATAPGNGYTVTDQATNLIYTLTLNGNPGDLPNQVGNGGQQTVTILGTMAANQAGTCNTSASTCTNTSSNNLNQTVTITY